VSSVRTEGLVGVMTPDGVRHGQGDNSHDGAWQHQWGQQNNTEEDYCS